MDSLNFGDTHLPHEMIHRIADPLERFLKIQAAAGALLLFATVIAVILSNSTWSEPFRRFWKVKTDSVKLISPEIQQGSSRLAFEKTPLHRQDRGWGLGGVSENLEGTVHCH